jgi:diphthine-ammonia ligase
MNEKNFITSWSGGKDCCLATIIALSDDCKLTGIVTMLNENGKVSRSHAIPLHILEQQAKAMKVPLLTTASTWDDYETNFIVSLKKASRQYHASMVVFGDIDTESHKLWEEKTAAAAGQIAYLPLWKKHRKKLVQQVIQCNIEAIIISCNTHLGKDFLGKKLNNETLIALENAGVDVCGENGEYHTLVVNCPLFNNAINYEIVEKLQHKDYCFLEIQ